MDTITVSGDQGYTQYKVKDLPAGTLIDAVSATFIQDNDADDGVSNPYPVSIKYSPDVVLDGGTILGEIDQTSEWRTVYDRGNSAGIRLEGSPNAVIRDWRITDAWDAIRISWDTPNFLIEDVWITNVRDDAIENDRLQSGTIRDSLFDGVKTGLSIDASSSDPIDGHTETVTFDGVLLRAKLYLKDGEMTHGALIKADSTVGDEFTPNLRFINCVFAIEDVDHNGYDRMRNAWAHTIESSGNVFLNLTDSPLPDDYPRPPVGWTIIEGQEARDYWEQARDAWIEAHQGVVDPPDPPDPAENSAPVITSPDAISMAENKSAALDVTAGDDHDQEGSGLSYSITGGTDSALFQIGASTGVLSFLAAPDFEMPGDAGKDNDYEVQVTVTDSGGLSDIQDITVTVTDAAENGATTVFERRVMASSDDAEERSSGRTNVTSSDLEMAYDGSRQQTVGIRFTAIDIPQHATITNAYIQFQVEDASTGADTLTIRGEDIGDAATFADADFNISARTTTDASATWLPPDWTTEGAAGAAQRTPDLTAVIQEIINRDDWAALNDLAIIITGTGTRSAESFDGSASAAPLLHIEWAPASEEGNPIVLDEPTLLDDPVVPEKPLIDDAASPTFDGTRFRGSRDDDVIIGNALGNDIDGRGGDDSIQGGEGNDTIRGNRGADVLSGGDGNDLFRFTRTSDSRDRSGVDIIMDFAEGDRIDLSGIDANSTVGGDQSFEVITGEFMQPGQLRFQFDANAGRTVVTGNTDTDASAEITILLDGDVALSDLDFML